MNRLAAVLLLSALGVVVACGSSTSQSSADGGTAANDGGLEASADGAVSVPACDGKTSDGILGTWGAVESAGGDGPNGIVPVNVAHHFCGTTSSGTATYTEDGKGFGGPGCEIISDIRGTFTFDGKLLAITNTSGFRSLRGCADGTANQEGNLTGPDTRTYEATIVGNQLTLKSTDPNGGSPETFTRE